MYILQWLIFFIRIYSTCGDTWQVSPHVTRIHHNIRNASPGYRGRHVLPPERIAKRLRYCRNYAHKTQKRPCMDAGARRTAPRTARFDGFVKHRNPSSIILYSILATQRSDDGSMCAPVVPKAYVPNYYPK